MFGSNVGASIGLMPNGLLILDQLGLYDVVKAAAQAPMGDSYTRGTDGSPISCITDFFNQVEMRFVLTFNGMTSRLHH